MCKWVEVPESSICMKNICTFVGYRLEKCLYSVLSNLFFAIFELNDLVKTNNFPTTNEKHKMRAYIQDNEGVDDFPLNSVILLFILSLQNFETVSGAKMSVA